MTIAVLGRGEASQRYSARGSEMFFKAVAAQDGGDFSLMERTLPPTAPSHELLRGLFRA